MPRKELFKMLPLMFLMCFLILRIESRSLVTIAWSYPKLGLHLHGSMGGETCLNSYAIQYFNGLFNGTTSLFK